MVEARPVDPKLQYRPLTLADRAQWARLLAISFGRTTDQMERLVEWFHAGFPLVTMGAWDGPRLVAQYNARILYLDVPGKPEPVAAGMGLNMAVDPQYRGRGLLATVATPVHEELVRQGCVAGVGFSTPRGLVATRAGGSYPYHDLGPMTSTVALVVRRRRSPELTFSADWPAGPLDLRRPATERIRYTITEDGLRHRFGTHPFRPYVFGAYRVAGAVVGITVHRPVRLRGVPATALLGAYGPEPDALVHRWAASLPGSPPVLVHAVTSPASAMRRAVAALGPSRSIPWSRERYHLIARRLSDAAPESLLDPERWDSVGGDIL
jgi:GNAT superfamily N-acetyltransferase